MEWWTRLTNRIRALTARGRLDDELNEELAAHLALKQKRLAEEGIPPEEAIRQARLALGNAALWKETTREEWSFTRIESLWKDVVFGARILIKDRAFTAVALITLTLGVGANAAVFALLNGLLWRALPVTEPDRLVRVRVTNLPPNERMWINGREAAPKERTQLSFPLFELLGRQSQLFDGVLGLAGQRSVVVDSGGTPHKLRMSIVTGSYFPLLGIQPAAGRLLKSEDDVPGGPQEGWGVVISDAAWSRLFGRSPDAIGKRVAVERVPFTVLGVAPPGFHGVNPGVDTEVWVALSAFESMFPKWHWRSDASIWMLQTMARLKPGMSIGAARQQLSALSRPLLEQVKEPGLSRDGETHFLAMKLDVVSARSGFSWLVETFGPALWTLMAAVAAVLLIAATNLTNLLLARSTARQREIAVRLALGASAGRIRRQLLVESALIAAAGSALGILFALWLRSALLRGVPGAENLQLDAPIDWRVVGFLAAVLSAVVLVAGWVPAWSAIRGALNEQIKQRAASKPVTYVRGGLVVLQVAFSLVLLGGAGLLLLSLRGLLNESTGFDSARTVFVSPDLFNAGITQDRMPRAYANLLDETRRQPGVHAAAWTLHMPLTGGLQAFTIEFPGSSAIPPMERMVFSHQVTDGYFNAIGLPLLAGRDFPPPGQTGPRYSIVSENVARKFFGSADAALGRRLKPGNLDWTQILGVVADAKYQHVREPNPLTVYTSYWDQQTTLGMTLVVKHDGPREPLLANLQALFQKEAGRLPFIGARTIGENIAASVGTERMLTALLGGFAVFAVLIAATGIAGLLSYAVQLKRHEIGIRIALGATASRIALQFERYCAGLVAAGLALGGMLSFWLRRVLDTYLFRVEAANLLLWIAVCSFLLLCALAAAAIPARRAARLDPIEVLRME